jgi:hypothetical protein
MKKFIKKVIVDKHIYKIFKPELSPKKNVKAKTVWWFLFWSKGKGIS